MGRPKIPRDLITLSVACKRYGVTDSTLRLWIRKGQLRGHGKRPISVSESALVALLKTQGRPHEPLDNTPAPASDVDPILDLATVADILGVEKQSASAYKSGGKLRSYRRSDVLEYRDSRASKDNYQKSGLADARTRREIAMAERAERDNKRAAGELYESSLVDTLASELGRLLSTQRQQGAQRLTAVVIRELGELGLVLTAEHRTTIVRAVGDTLDMQGQALDKLLDGMSRRPSGN